MIDFTVEKVIAEISSTAISAKRLTLTSRNGRPAKLDLRTWHTDGAQDKPGKGMTLDAEEAEKLSEALSGFLS